MIVFIDESGDHNLDIAKLDNTYNIFTLGAVCFQDKDYEIFDSEFKNLKKKLFGTDQFVVHTAEITRPNKSKDPLNLQFNSPNFRREFYSEMNNLISKTSFKIICCVIRKHDLIGKYAENAQDPYLLSFENVLNRILFRSVKSEKITIYPEKRTHVEDIKLDLAWLREKALGTRNRNLK